MSEEVIRLLRIRGRVQGVGYRAFVQEHAIRHGFRGWTRNRSDGSVEALVAGEAEAAKRLIAKLRDGPPAARIADIEEQDAGPEALIGYEDDFAILPTL
ncbi:MAG TPA: acylphosphatase [Roseiarcus sp.]|nr:acylphosphatase [Roseiarcus sp.]